MKAAEINAPRRIEMLQGLAVRQVPYIILPCHDRDYIELEWSMTFFLLSLARDCINAPQNI